MELRSLFDREISGEDGPRSPGPFSPGQKPLIVETSLSDVLPSAAV